MVVKFLAEEHFWRLVQRRGYSGRILLFVRLHLAASVARDTEVDNFEHTMLV
jgi:hypothetical protein